MEDTVKKKIFALYWGQQVFAMGANAIVRQQINGYMLSHAYRDAYLLLAPLSAITDEDARYLCNTYLGLSGGYTYINSVESDNGVLAIDLTNAAYIPCARSIGFLLQTAPSNITDYLRSKGYALPAYGYTVEELVKEGVFILKEL